MTGILELPLDNLEHHLSDPQGVSPCTKKAVKCALSAYFRDYIFLCDHRVVLEDFRVTGGESKDFLNEIK